MWKTLWKPAVKTVEYAIALAAAIVLAACARAPEAEAPADAAIPLSEQFSSDFSLVDMNGAPAGSADFRGKVMVVYFGFASCPDVCPLALSKLSAALNELSEAEQAELAPLFITVDPERDTPGALKAYLAFDDRILGLTGDQAAVDAARQSFKVYARRHPLEGSALGYAMDHLSLYYLVDRTGRPKFALRDSITTDELTVMLRRSIAG